MMDDVNVIEHVEDGVAVPVAVRVKLAVRLVLLVDVAVKEAVPVRELVNDIDRDDEGVLVGDCVTEEVTVGAMTEFDRFPQKPNTDNHFSWPQHGSPRVPCAFGWNLQKVLPKQVELTKEKEVTESHEEVASNPVVQVPEGFPKEEKMSSLNRSPVGQARDEP